MTTEASPIEVSPIRQESKQIEEQEEPQLELEETVENRLRGGGRRDKSRQIRRSRSRSRSRSSESRSSSPGKTLIRDCPDELEEKVERTHQDEEAMMIESTTTPTPDEKDKRDEVEDRKENKEEEQEEEEEIEQEREEENEDENDQEREAEKEVVDSMNTNEDAQEEQQQQQNFDQNNQKKVSLVLVSVLTTTSDIHKPIKRELESKN